jgi:hypothetical protein
MDEQRHTHDVAEDSNYRWIQVSLGILLLTMGIVGVMWTLYSIAYLTTSPHDVQVLAQFTSLDEHATIRISPDATIQLPDGVFYALGFFLYVVMLGIAGSLTKALLSTGTRLLEPDIRSFLSRLREVRASKEYGGHRVS